MSHETVNTQSTELNSDSHSKNSLMEQHMQNEGVINWILIGARNKISTGDTVEESYTSDDLHSWMSPETVNT